MIALSTSEDPLWDHLDKNGPRRIRGEEVRMINVPACVSEMQDVFDGKHARAKVGKTVERRRRFVENQERLARQYQGEALRAYLAERVSDKAARTNLKRYMKEFTDNAPLPDQQRWLGRIQRLFAAVYASAAQAIDYGVLPWGKRSMLSAIRACMIDAMQQLIANSGSDAESDRGGAQSNQSILAEFKQRLDDAKFVRLERNRRKKKALRGSTRNGRRHHPPYQAGQVRVPAVRSDHESLVPGPCGSKAARKAATVPANPKGGTSNGYQHPTGTDR